MMQNFHLLGVLGNLTLNLVLSFSVFPLNQQYNMNLLTAFLMIQGFLDTITSQKDLRSRLQHTKEV